MAIDLKDNNPKESKENNSNLAVKYGLPPHVEFCKSCVISNQRPSSVTELANKPLNLKPTINLDKNGICDACNFAKYKNLEIDWKERERSLVDLLNKYRSRNSSYDILVPGSGGKDSIFASHILKYKYNMNPLTVTWAPHLYTDVGFKNFEGWLHKGGFDNFLFTPDGKIHRKLTQLAYRNLLHPFQPFIIGQKYFAPKMAVKFNIPIVFYGENEAEYGNSKDENNTSKRDSKYFTSNNISSKDLFFGGVSLDDLKDHSVNIDNLTPYLPLDINILHKNDIQVHYLGYYIKWVPQECYYYAVENTGFIANDERTEGTYSKYNSIDDKTDGFHYWTTYIKFGIGRTTYDASQEIRNDHINRDEGVSLVHRYDGEFPKRYFNEFLEYLNMNEDEFFEIADNFRSPHLWKKDGLDYILRHKVR